MHLNHTELALLPWLYLQLGVHTRSRLFQPISNIFSDSSEAETPVVIEESSSPEALIPTELEVGPDATYL